VGIANAFPTKDRLLGKKRYRTASVFGVGLPDNCSIGTEQNLKEVDQCPAQKLVKALASRTAQVLLPRNGRVAD
jgi:hypothetical protein